MVNLTNLSTAANLFDLANFANESTNGLFWGLILIAVFIIVTINLRYNGIDRAVAAASFLCLIISVFLAYLNFINILYPVLLSIALAGSLYYIRSNNP
jgi:hypothetical protein